MARTRLHLDFESSNELDLTTVGLARYAAHRSAKILMASWRIDDEKANLWVPEEGQAIPKRFHEALNDPQVLVVAFNAGFERAIINKVLSRDYAVNVSIDRLRCSMALAYMFSFMGGLDDISEQMQLKLGKDPRGKSLIKIFCMPNKPTKNQPFVWRSKMTDPDAWEQFKRYCLRDNDAEHELWTKLSRFPVPQWQWDAFALDQKINERGLPVNRKFVENALVIADRRKTELISEQNRITELANSNSGAQLLPWLQNRGYPYSNLQKANVVKILAQEIEDVKTSPMDFQYACIDAIGQVTGEAILTPDCRNVLRMRQASSKTSTAKYDACINALMPDNRLYGAFQFAGASRTNRWAGRVVQPHNLPRTPKWLEHEDNIDFERLDYCNQLIENGEYETLGVFAGEQMDAVAGCVRSLIQTNEGETLVVEDLSSIESVVIFWLAMCERGLEVFRSGRCAYKDFATTFYGVAYDAVTKAMRTNSKPAVLGAGYRLSGGEMRNGEKTGLWAYAEGMGVKLSQEESNKAVKIFRETYKEIPKAWYSIEDAIAAAMVAGGGIVKWGYLEFQIEKPFLRIGLPSGRSMWYYKLQVEMREVEGFYGPYMRKTISYMGKDQITGQWCRIESHGGKFIENIVQGIARDILVFGMIEADTEGFDIVGHVHDEIITQRAFGDLYHTEELLRDCMTTRIQKKYRFLATMPLNAAGYENRVYRKD